MAHCVSLMVKPLNREDVYRDRVRIPVLRGQISEGAVCRLLARDKSVLVEVRGVEGRASGSKL